VRDLWAHADLGLFTSYSVVLGGGGTSTLLRLTAPSTAV
jgi:hypothetical protein